MGSDENTQIVAPNRAGAGNSAALSRLQIGRRARAVPDQRRWKQDGIWLFALLPGTNRTKPEGMIKATPLKLLDLEECFAGYAEGENIFWVVDAKFGRPEAEVIRQVQSAALKSKVNLVFP
jgi:hypothetical protein